MSVILFEPAFVGQLTVRNRLMRSATAERVADPVTGAPGARQAEMYRVLAEGEIGLIVTGHAYVERPGKAHPEMASIADDNVIAAWREAIRPAQDAGARVMMQINHCGASCDPLVTSNPLSPSGAPTNRLNQPRAASEEEIERVIAAFAQAARRARDAGLDGVQLHGAHGYLINQFMMPSTNLRNDAWGGDAARRQTFLRSVVAAIRTQVGDDYPLWIKLGVASDAEHGLAIAAGAEYAAACAGWGIDAIEISNALGVPEELDLKSDGAYVPLARVVRQAVGPSYALAVVNGFRSPSAAEQVLASGTAQMLSLCRPLIAEPDLAKQWRDGRSTTVACVRCGRCWPEGPGQGVDCHNAQVRKKLGLASNDERKENG
jgi:2,4-dienoyl-CoA reductase-like NADH-dependent reductase (Old Yellow Enzyme family)